MSMNTLIEWTDATWNPVRGCSMVSAGCTNCYAMGVAHRFSKPGLPYEGLTMTTSQGVKWTGKIRLVPELLEEPKRWKQPKRIFVNSMSDLFHEDVPDRFIAQVWNVMAGLPHHTFQILTKRPERMRAWINKVRKHSESSKLVVFPGEGKEADIYVGDVDTWPLPNVWLGVSVENQETADVRIPLLLDMLAAVRWVSMEPLLGPVDLRRIDRNTPTLWWIDWVVVGGESGSNARPVHPEWARSIQEHCNSMKVPFFFKQWGEWAPARTIPRDTLLPWRKWGYISVDGGAIHQSIRPFENEYAHHELMAKLGKKAAGRILDGQEWNEVPA